MGFTNSELDFIDKHSELIEEGEPKLAELAKKVIEDFRDVGRGGLQFLLGYNCLGDRVAKVTDLTTEITETEITGCIVNRTPARRAKGVPLLPSLFTAKTGVVLYSILKGQIVKEDKYKLSTKEEFNKIQSQGGYNLVVIDRPENVASVKNCFGGILLYKAIIKVDPRLTLCRNIELSVQSESPEKGTELIISMLPDTIEFKWHLSKFPGVKSDLVKFLSKQIIFKD